MNGIESKEICKLLQQLSKKASNQYSDNPLDYKGRAVTPEIVRGAAKNPHYLDVIEAVVTNSNGPKVLDIGISYGLYDVVLKKHFRYKVYGIDHPDNIDVYCRFPIYNNIYVLPCQLHYDNIPFKNGSFNTIIAAEIVEHLMISPTALFKKLNALLKPGGRIIVTTPNFSNLRNILYLLRGFSPIANFPDEAILVNRIIQDTRVHPREYTAKEIKNALLGANFNIIKIRTTNRGFKKNIRFRAKILNLLMMLTPLHRERTIVIGAKN
jgi:2-polyprenyl-3-methyl-5-hydroxy-6-metoxy-1,4-benzoquinol methylase